MKIAFPEYHNEIVQSAIKKAENIEAIEAANLEDACEKVKNHEADAISPESIIRHEMLCSPPKIILA